MIVKRLSDELITRELQLYGTIASARLCDQIRAYIDLLLRWNEKTALTAVTQPEEILRFHFGESILAASSVPIRHGRLADVGSGAGFPAVPVRMVSENLSVILIESNQKKATFLAEVGRELQFNNVEVHRSRMEDVSLRGEPVDFVSARAVRIDHDFLDWSHHSLNLTGSLVLWLGEEDASKISRSSQWKWGDPIRIPQSERRVILHGKKL
jgi:16S rRNA (guanine527-N7)-methyltransferase